MSSAWPSAGRSDKDIGLRSAFGSSMSFRKVGSRETLLFQYVEPGPGTFKTGVSFPSCSLNGSLIRLFARPREFFAFSFQCDDCS